MNWCPIDVLTLRSCKEMPKVLVMDRLSDFCSATCKQEAVDSGYIFFVIYLPHAPNSYIDQHPQYSSWARTKINSWVVRSRACYRCSRWFRSVFSIWTILGVVETSWGCSFGREGEQVNFIILIMWLMSHRFGRFTTTERSTTRSNSTSVLSRLVRHITHNLSLDYLLNVSHASRTATPADVGTEPYVHAPSGIRAATYRFATRMPVPCVA